MTKSLLRLGMFAWLLALLLLATMDPPRVQSQGGKPYEHLRMGNPSNAKADPKSKANYLLKKEQYALSYNEPQGIPNWVSWHLSKAWFGKAERAEDFLVDPTLPAGFYRVSSDKYLNTGFDRGHMCPSADRTKSEADNRATFYMTNIIPQAPGNNRKAWKNMEEYCRKLVRKDDKELYIICGPFGSGGVGRKKDGTIVDAKSIDAGKVNVPSHVWKVALVLPKGKTDPARVTKDTRVIAVDIPNAQKVGGDWGKYRVSAESIETKTSYKFFTKVPDDVRKEIIKQVDKVPIE